MIGLIIASLLNFSFLILSFLAFPESILASSSLAAALLHIPHNCVETELTASQYSCEQKVGCHANRSGKVYNNYGNFVKGFVCDLLRIDCKLN